MLVEATETEAYQILENQFQTHATITEVIKALCYGKSNMQLLIDGSTEVCFGNPSLCIVLTITKTLLFLIAFFL